MADDITASLQHNNLLYDFYSALLTQKQRDVFFMYYMEDMSLAEIARLNDTSPQAVQDLVKRTKNKLQNYEDKLWLVKKHLLQKKVAAEIKKLTGDSDKDSLIRSLVDSMLN